MISRESIEEVLARTDIQSLISGYVSLKRAGNNLKGLCPFHSEKSPSFTVYPQNNSFYCFGCGQGGDQISFIMKAEHLDYPDAVQFLAKRAGITLMDSDTIGTQQTPKFDKNRIYRMNRDAAKYFNAMLFSENEEAKAGLRYFTEKRGLSTATIKHFGLGFAPNSYDAFSKYMLRLGYNYDELVAGFLCGKSERGRYYDAFRNRVMFPIIDVAGNVIAFGGRVMDDSKPKYKNSSDTPVFKKSRNLFALNFAKSYCEECLILCEGYMDVIALHAAGVNNAIATLGTAITSEQARVMSRYTKKVVISYDADEAGKKAATRAMALLEEVGLEVKVLTLPGAKDPDEYIKTYGVEKFKEVLYGAKTKFDYNLDNIFLKYDISIPQDKINALNELTKLISGFYSSAERDVYIHTVAKKMDMSPAGIKEDVNRLIIRNAAQAKRETGEKIKRESAGYSDRTNPDFIKAPSVARNEECVLGILLLYAEHRKRIFDSSILTEDDFVTDLNKRVFNYLKEAYAAGDVYLTDLNDIFNEDEVNRISRMKITRLGYTNDTDVLDECIKILKRSVVRERAKQSSSIESLNEILKRKRNE